MCKKTKMPRYSIQPRNKMFLKGYGLFTFPTNISQNIGKKISNNLNGI